MPAQPRKLSEIMKEMSETLLRKPGGVPSSEAAHVALFFANVAWNESVGLDHAREGYRNVWETIEAENPALCCPPRPPTSSAPSPTSPGTRASAWIIPGKTQGAGAATISSYEQSLHERWSVMRRLQRYKPKEIVM